MARHRQSIDSLELLLDAICNTFGGIVFIALLVVILLQMSGERIEETASPDRSLSAREIALLKKQLDAADTELSRLRELRDSQDETLANLAPPDLEVLLADLEAVQQRMRSEHEHRGRLLDDSADVVENTERILAEIEALESDLVAVSEEVRTLREQLAAERESRRRESRTPKLRDSGFKRSVGLVLQYGKLYVWHKYDAAGVRRGLNTDEFIVIDDTTDGLITTPRPTAGTVVDGSATSVAALRSRLREFPPDRFYVEVVVRPDSFADFKHLQSFFTQAGYSYRLLPTSADGAIIDRGGSDSRVQ